jgi:phage terminase large subunit
VATKSHVAVKGCHASGKTYDAAGLVPYWITQFRDGLVLNVAPTFRQVKLFWREVNTAVNEAVYPMPVPQTTALEITKDNYAMGFSATKGVNAQGFHAAKGLLICDEAPGIPAEVWEAIDGITAGGDWTILEMGNPTIPSGRFYDSFGSNKASVHQVTISAFDTPNFDGLTIERILAMDDESLRLHVKHRALVRPLWVKQMYNRWGPVHPSYQSRVLGQFPAQSKFSVFNSEWVTRAGCPLKQQHWRDCKEWEGILQVGVDVAGAGDDETACCARIGQLVIAADAWGDADARGPVSLFLSRLRVAYPKARIVVMVDVTGVGYFLAKHIADQGYEVYGFVAAGKAIDQTSFLNAKAEAYDALAKWMERGILGVTDLDTQGQLIGIQYKPTSTGQIQIEPKDEAKKRGLSSPDRAEALVLAFAPVILKNQTVTWQEQGLRQVRHV